jgi:hypothetical protein
MNKFSRWVIVVLGIWAMNDQVFGQLSVVRVQLPSTLLALKPADPKYIKVAAKQIDTYVIAELKRKSKRPQPFASDEQFVRRVYVSIAGRIPTYVEATKFLADEDEDKRFNLVNALMESDAYTMNMFNYWADILRAKEDWGGGRTGRAYIKWIRDAINGNMPYNKMVHELVTAEGGMWAPDNGAVGYYARDRGMPLDNMANTTRIFLGTQIACAQCHDHPHEKWSQMEFYQMSAFTHNLTTLGSKKKFPNIDKMFDNRKDPESRRLRDVDRWLRYEFMDSYIVGSGAGRIKLPMDYKYKDGDPNEWVGARTMMGKSVRNLKDDKDMSDARKRFADWMTAPENPTFTAVIANRMWKRVMGVGLVEPTDNFKKGTVPTNPQLLAYLNKLMEHVKYDLRIFQKIVYASKAYQLGPNPEEVNTRHAYYYEGYPLQRMTSEQIWDSMLALTIDEPEKPKANRYSDAVVWRGKAVLGNKNMAEIQREIATMEPEQYVSYLRKISKDMEKGYDGGNSMMMMGKRGRGGAVLARASELPSPTGPTHFLRKFGQSDREIIEGSSREGDVTQALTLLNGHVERHITGNSSASVMRNISAAKTPEEQVDIAFMSILTRTPSDVEKEIFLPEVKRGREGQRNMVAALVNTSEFMHVQ